ncbi:hypothetical protein GHT06_008900 [Daphnia sinensis]|uniref:Helitron helicase-like domain-containing protein n=1 Tax=Daphnia sinensis TaxID=1820382 RepID=A0AAD5L219_9CRUS|nr:hypothetical protein GHT06_008900 [Daphnia sinensis]
MRTHIQKLSNIANKLRERDQPLNDIQLTPRRHIRRAVQHSKRIKNQRNQELRLLCFSIWTVDLRDVLYSFFPIQAPAAVAKTTLLLKRILNQQLETELCKTRVQHHTGIFPALDNFLTASMLETLESIPEQLIRRTTVVGDESETQIDRLVHQQAQTPDTINDVKSDDQLNDDPTTDSMSFLTKSGCLAFPLGKGLRRTGSVTQKDVYHMDNQWHGKFAKCLRFQFLLFDQLQRHSEARAVKASHAKNHPNTAESKALLAKMTPHISLVNRKFTYSTAERTGAVGHLMNTVRYYGAPSIFNTISLDNVHGMLNILPIHPPTLRILLAEGPAFAANVYYKISVAVFGHLFGTPPDCSEKKKSIPLPKRKAGIFGVPIAAFGCTEEQARGSLHMHTIGGIPVIAHHISNALDRIIMAQLQPQIHIRHLLRDLHNESPNHAHCLNATSPSHKNRYSSMISNAPSI